MGQHRGHAGHGTGRAAMGQLAVHFRGDGIFPQCQDNVGRRLRHRRGGGIHHPLTEARRGQVDAVFGDDGGILPGFMNQAQGRAAEGQQIAQPAAPQLRGASAKKLLRPGIGVAHAVITVQYQNWMGQGIQNGFKAGRVGRGRNGFGNRRGVRHQAASRAIALS